MLTKEAVLEAVRTGRKSGCERIDGRDYARLVDFFPSEDWKPFGFSLKDDAEPRKPKKWTEEAVKARLAHDLDFAFEKALDRRGISASLMQEVIKMWMWVLEDPLQHHDDYAEYGLPLLKKVAMKYGLPNQIGDDSGSEAKYSCD